jgi:2-polyprenyl-3-methyl-5-hydroxy-6-metoxy-1,4-benzoquinol methylase
MINALRTGKPQSWGGKKNKPAWAKAMLNPDFVKMFTAGMDSRGAYYANSLPEKFNFGKYNSLIDIGGGSGIYAASIVKKHPFVDCAVLEKQPVDMITRMVLKERKLQNKIEVIKGDMFKLIPGGYDVHLFSHVLHDWDYEQNYNLIKNSYASLNKHGIIMIHDAHLNGRKDGPLSVAEYSVLLMFSTPGKCYSVIEMKEMLESAGFKKFRITSNVGNRSIITAAKF